MILIETKIDTMTDEFALSWNESGIEKDDVVLVHSSLSKFLNNYKSKGIDISPSTILDSLTKAVGDNGTLIFPTYNFDFVKGITFDIRNTKSETGVLTELARLNPKATRTVHPMFSFAVIGKHKVEFSNLNNFSAFGRSSPFAKLLELNGKIAALDIAGEYCMTFYHHVEEMENAPNRFHKIFRGNYIDYTGKESVKEFDVYSRKIDMGVETNVKPMEEYLWSKGMYSGYRPGEGSCMHVIQAKVVYEETANIIKEGKSLGMLYKITRKD